MSTQDAVSTPHSEVACEDQQRSCACISLRKITHSITCLYDFHLKECMLRVTQIPLLEAIVKMGESGISHHALADLVELNQSTLSRSLRPLLQAGLIRAKVGKDRRSKLICATDKGATLYSTVRVHLKEAEGALYDLLGRDGWNALQCFLEQGAGPSWHDEAERPKLSPISPRSRA